MMPNKTKTNRYDDLDDELLFQCDCGGNHYLEVSHWGDEDDLWFNFIDYPKGIWHMIKSLWKWKSICVSDIELNKEDAKELLKVLIKFIGKDNQLKK